MLIRIIIILNLALLASCKTTYTSMIISDNYDAKTNITTLALLPYGNIDIPGHWKKTKYLETSKQHFFQDYDSTIIAIAKTPQEDYSFYSESMSNLSFAEAFFLWDSEFYKENGYKPEIVNTDIKGDFVVWKVIDRNTCAFLLYGGKDSYAYNFGIFSDNWPDEEKINFLIDLFINN